MKRLSIYRFYALLAMICISLQLNSQITLDLKVFLEGPFNGVEMNTNLNDQGLLPLNQPYNVEPWNYPGSEEVMDIPNADIVDWVLIELRETTGTPASATPFNSIDKQASFILKNGEIVALDGSSLITYAGSITDNLYVIIWHRNHLPVMSSVPLSEVGGTYSWDFTDQVSKAYLIGQKDLGVGKCGMIGGDCNSDGWINILDKNENWTNTVGEAGYYSCDVNLDTQINNSDKDEVWLQNKNQELKLPEDLTFNCGNPLVDERDDRVYSTVQIGNQCWMAENLNAGIIINGDVIQPNNGMIEKHCYSNNNANCNTYGGLYQWDEMMDYNSTEGTRGICVVGWHIPTDNDFCQLTTFLDNTVNCLPGELGTNIGSSLKSTLGWYGSGNGTNSSGFTALPSGWNDEGWFGALGQETDYWTSSRTSIYDEPWVWTLSYYTSSIIHSKSYIYSTGSISVRCIKDLPNMPSNPNPPDGSINQSIDTINSWSIKEPINEPLTFDVYFGTTNPPELVSEGQFEFTYDPPEALNINTTYYWQVVAIDNENNQTSGPNWTFTTGFYPCPDVETVDYEGQTYHTVLIGSQCWLQENLNVGVRIDGSDEQSDDDIIEKYCYNDLESNCDTYGGLYQWNEMMNYNTSSWQGICPPGWKVPSDADWCILEVTIDPTTVCGDFGFRGTDGGKKMKAAGTAWNPPGTNNYGFTALASGVRTATGYFLDLGSYEIFWSRTLSEDYHYWTRWLYQNDDRVYRAGEWWPSGYSVRCIKE